MRTIGLYLFLRSMSQNLQKFDKNLLQRHNDVIMVFDALTAAVNNE